jgi:hypothetical protein
MPWFVAAMGIHFSIIQSLAMEIVGVDTTEVGRESTVLVAG